MYIHIAYKFNNSTIDLNILLCILIINFSAFYNLYKLKIVIIGINTNVSSYNEYVINKPVLIICKIFI